MAKCESSTESCVYFHEANFFGQFYLCPPKTFSPVRQCTQADSLLFYLKQHAKSSHEKKCCNSS